MPKYDINDNLKRLEKNSSLVDILIQVEDFFDSLDLYAFRNWFDAEIVAGPFVKRYWIKVTLRWDYDDMPDPQGAIRLLYHNAKVKFFKQKEQIPVEIDDPSDYRNDQSHRPKKKEITAWYAEITIPRRFIEDRAEDLSLYDDEVDIDDVEDAQDRGVSTKDSYINDQDERDQEEKEEEEDEES